MLSNDYGSVFTSTVQKFQENDQPSEQAAETPDEEDDAQQATRHRRIREEKDFFIVHERNIRHLERFVGSINHFGETRTSIVMSQPIPLRPLQSPEGVGQE
eukprot:gene18870-23112_t